MTHNMVDVCAGRADSIRRRITAQLGRAQARFAGVSPWSADVSARLAEFACRGKLIRGNLVLLGVELAGGEPSEAAYDLAAALELFHSSILIHDDIIDQDAVRRGAPAVHAAYARRLDSEGCAAAQHLGAALALCAGDIGFYLVFGAVAEAALDDAHRMAMVRLWAHEFAAVAFAEMDDVSLASRPAPAAEADILRCYRHKTARYTFCLPLRTGLTLAGAPEELCGRIEQIAERLGLVFQLKDDELDLFGQAAETGKPVGSDIAQNKKTLYHHRLLTRTEGAVHARLAAVFGSHGLSPEDIAFVQQTAIETGVKAEIAAMAQRLAAEAGELIEVLPVAAGLRSQLAELARFSLSRAR